MVPWAFISLLPRTAFDRFSRDLSMSLFSCDPIQPNPSADWPNPTQPSTSGKNWTQPSTANSGTYSLIVTYFYTQNLSRTFSQPSINLFMHLTDRALNVLTWFFQILVLLLYWTQPKPTHQKLKNLDPTQPNTWVNPTHGQLWFSCCCRAHGRDQHTDRHTDRSRYSVRLQ